MPDSEANAQGLIKTLEAAWNASDGAAFAAVFTEDADFVSIRADHVKGRGAIAVAHQALFDSMYKGSRVDYNLIQAREIAPGVTLAHVSGTLSAPTGPLAGVNRSIYSIVVQGSGESARIAAFQNTLIPPSG